jgi:starch synthase
LQMVILGTGDPKYHQLLEKLAKKYPDKLAVNIRFDNKLAHLIEAGADMFLMPSRYEPCGLNQMYSLKYGTVPVVRETGGLADTICNYDPKTGEGNGFTFKAYKSKDMVNTIKRAVKTFQDQETWTKIQKTGMTADYSWDLSAKKYMDLYQNTFQE